MKIISITQARMGSARLPGKVLKEIGGKSLLAIHLERLKRSKLITDIFVATSDSPADNAIIGLCDSLKINSFRGSENDVLDRFYQLAKKHQPDYIVRLTADCPLTDAHLVDKIISACIDNKKDYCSNTIKPTFPDGTDVEVFTFAALEKAWKEAELKSDKEHVTPFIYRNADTNNKYLFKALSVENETDYSHLRLTVDEQNDLNLIAALINKLGTNKSWEEYATYLTAHPEIAEINKAHKRNEGYSISLKKEQKKVFLRADGNTQVGLGHIFRQLALADMLREKFNLYFVINSSSVDAIPFIKEEVPNVIVLEKTENLQQEADELARLITKDDIVVLDGYDFNTDYQKKIKTTGCPLVCVDDLHAHHFVADILINQAEAINETTYSKENHTRLFHGFKYALLRKPFLTAAQHQRSLIQVKNLLISTGGADVHNISFKILLAALKTKLFSSVNIITGSINPNLPQLNAFANEFRQHNIKVYTTIGPEQIVELFANTDMAICTASIISLEACSVGTALLCGYTSANQADTLLSLEKSGAAFNMGDLNAIRPEELEQKISFYTKDLALLNRHINAQKKVLDGFSGKRIEEIFLKL